MVKLNSEGFRQILFNLYPWKYLGVITFNHGKRRNIHDLIDDRLTTLQIPVGGKFPILITPKVVFKNNFFSCCKIIVII